MVKDKFCFEKKKLEILGFSLLSTHGNSTFFLLITYPRYSSYFLFTLIPEISICSFFNAPLGRSEVLHGGECINSHKYLLCWTYYKSVGFCWTYLSHQGLILHFCYSFSIESDQEYLFFYQAFKIKKLKFSGKVMTVFECLQNLSNISKSVIYTANQKHTQNYFQIIFKNAYGYGQILLANLFCLLLIIING